METQAFQKEITKVKIQFNTNSHTKTFLMTIIELVYKAFRNLIFISDLRFSSCSNRIFVLYKCLAAFFVCIAKYDVNRIYLATFRNVK